MTVRPTTRGGGLWGVSSTPSACGVKKPPLGEGVVRCAERSSGSRSRNERHDDLGAPVLGAALGGGVVVGRLGRALRDGRDAARIDAVAGDEVLLGGLGP